MFNAETLTDMLENQAKNLEVYTYESVTSTNDLAKEFAQKNPNKEAVIIALKNFYMLLKVTLNMESSCT